MGSPHSSLESGTSKYSLRPSPQLLKPTSAPKCTLVSEHCCTVAWEFGCTLGVPAGEDCESTLDGVDYDTLGEAPEDMFTMKLWTHHSFTQMQFELPGCTVAWVASGKTVAARFHIVGARRGPGGQT